MTIKSVAASAFVLSSRRLNGSRRSNKRKGAALVLILILLPALIAVAAFAINIVHLQTMNTEVQIAADAAVRSAAIEYAISGGDKDQALLAARDSASRNPIGTHVLPLNAEDLDFGQADRPSATATYTFTEITGSGGDDDDDDDDDGGSTVNGNAVRLVTRTLANGGGPSIKPIFLLAGDMFELRSLRESIAAMASLDLSIVVDRSGSMAYSSGEAAVHPPNPANAPSGWDFGNPVPPQARWLDLVAAMGTFRMEMEDSSIDEQVSLTVYNTVATTPVSLTTNYDNILNALDDISVNFTLGGTNIGGGMLAGADSIQGTGVGRSFATKVAIVMTDGNHNYGTSPTSAASTLKAQGITVFTVTFSDEADQSLMQNVAATCGGQHYHATTGAQLQQAFRDIARSMPNLLVK